jgi:hypothetical protein
MSMTARMRESASMPVRWRRRIPQRDHQLSLVNPRGPGIGTGGVCQVHGRDAGRAQTGRLRQVRRAPRHGRRVTDACGSSHAANHHRPITARTTRKAPIFGPGSFTTRRVSHAAGRAARARPGNPVSRRRSAGGDRAYRAAATERGRASCAASSGESVQADRASVAGR